MTVLITGRAMLKMGRTVPSSVDLDWIKRRERGKQQHSPLSSYCECDVSPCLRTLMSRLPYHDRLHTQTMSQHKPSLPLSGPQNQKLIQLCFWSLHKSSPGRGFSENLPLLRQPIVKSRTKSTISFSQ